MPDMQVVQYSKTARTGKPRFKRKARKGKLTTKTLAKKIDRVAKKVILRPERKFADTVGSYANMDDAAEASVLLNGVANGATTSTRVGNRVRGSYIVLRGTFFRNAAANQLSDVCRIVIVQDRRQRSDAGPNYTDVFTNPSWQSHMNWDNRGRFRILYDRTFELDANNPSQSMKAVIPTRFVTGYNGNASTDIEQNGVYLLGIGSDANAGGDGPSFLYNVRYVFTDA